MSMPTNGQEQARESIEHEIIRFAKTNIDFPPETEGHIISTIANAVRVIGITLTYPDLHKTTEGFFVIVGKGSLSPYAIYSGDLPEDAYPGIILLQNLETGIYTYAGECFLDGIHLYALPSDNKNDIIPNQPLSDGAPAAKQLQLLVPQQGSYLGHEHPERFSIDYITRSLLNKVNDATPVIQLLERYAQNPQI